MLNYVTCPNSTLKCDSGLWFHVELLPGSRFHVEIDPGPWLHVELWPEVWIPREIVTPRHHWKFNCDQDLFNVEFGPEVTIKRGILIRGHNSTWNYDPSTSLLPMELRLKKVSNFTIQRKIHWILTPCRYAMERSKFYLTPDLRG